MEEEAGDKGGRDEERKGGGRKERQRGREDGKTEKIKGGGITWNLDLYPQAHFITTFYYTLICKVTLFI